MRAAALLLFGVGGCVADIGRPTVDEIVQDSGVVDAGIDVAPVLTADGATCAKDAECQSGHCFLGGMASYCSEACTAANAQAVCATAPFNGVCNNRGFCRRP